MKNYLRKVNKYPINLVDPNSKQQSAVKLWLTGIFNYDKICSSTGSSVQKIEETFDANFDVVVCVK
jgi:hypothetical protein